MVSRLVKEQLRATDTFARFGGEEFVCMLEEIDMEEARRTAERIRACIASAELKTEETTVHVTIRIGLAELDDPGLIVLDELLKRADEALYHAKADGHNRVCVWRMENANTSA